MKLPGNGCPRPLPPPYPRRGEIWGGSRPVRGGQAGTLARCESEVKYPGNGRPRPLPPRTPDVVKFGVVRIQSSDHSGLDSMPKLNFSVIVTPACGADMETEVLVARGAPERGLPPLVGQVSIGSGREFLQVFVVLGATNHAEVVAGDGRGTFGVVLSHALQTKEVGLLGPGFAAVDCCAVVANELQAEFIYEHVEGAKEVAGTGVRSVGIHDDVGVVGGPDEKLHEEPARPAVVASRLVQACDLVVLVHGSHVPETRGKVRVPGGRTFMQNCVKRSRMLTYLV